MQIGAHCVSFLAQAADADPTLPITIGIVALLLIGIPIAAVILRAATLWVAKFHLPFVSAYGIALLTTIVNTAVQFTLGLLIPNANNPANPNLAGNFLLLIIGFAIASFLYGALIRDYGKAVGSAKGVLIALTTYAIILVIAVFLAAVVYLVGQFTGYRFLS